MLSIGKSQSNHTPPHITSDYNVQENVILAHPSRRWTVCLPSYRIVGTVLAVASDSEVCSSVCSSVDLSLLLARRHPSAQFVSVNTDLWTAYNIRRRWSVSFESSLHHSQRSRAQNLINVTVFMCVQNRSSSWYWRREGRESRALRSQCPDQFDTPKARPPE